MEDSKVLKKGFFKKVWYSIFKLERYGEMAAEGVPRAIFYTIKLALVISLITALGAIFQANKLVEKGKDFIETQVGEFTYKDGILDIEKEEPIRAPSENFGEVIVNTKLETTEEVNQLVDSVKGKGIIVLKDGILAKGFTSQGILVYKYTDLAQGLNIQEAHKQDVINFLGGENSWKLYAAVAVAITLYMLLNYTLQFLWYNVVLGLFGFIVTYFSRIKMRFAAIFNMTCYAFTLSILLQTIYIGINIFVNFEMKYFQIMYIAVAAIYLIAAIFLIKAEFLKQQIEAAQMVKIKKDDNEENEQDKENEGDNKGDNKEDNKEENKKPEEQPKDSKDKKKKKDGAEPEGSEA